ncbi:MAG: hypothetical protein J6I72_05805 [Muribaculaceae bacterium]|nr:hypothetical protein [Muribaculaceae bacterium]
MKNLRKDEETGALVVTGLPQAVSEIPAGHRLALVDEDRMLTLCDGNVCYDGVPLAAVPGHVVGLHRVGDLVVVTASLGTLYLLRGTTTYEPVRAADAIPSLTLAEQDRGTLSASLPALAFAEPYSTWQAPLQAADVKALTTSLRTAWSTLTGQAAAAGMHYAPMQVRYGVRLWDDSYLWMSAPVTLGMARLSNAPWVTVDVTVDGGKGIGVPATTLALGVYGLQVTVNSGPGNAWKSMIKAVDILATTPADVVETTAAIHYRCLNSSAGRVPVLDYGFPGRTAAQAQAQMDRSLWTVLATCSDLDALAQGRWVPDAVPASIALSGQQCDAARFDTTRGIVASLVCNGRLYCADATGLMTTSAPANPLVTARSYRVTGSAILGLAAVPRSLYSGGFGRYPVYLFTAEGIYALPLTSQGIYGEPRLLDRTILALGCVPVEGDRDIFFMSSRGHLCRLRASTVTIMARNAVVAHLAWDAEHGELWCLDAQEHARVLTATGDLVERSLAATHLYSDITHALAIDERGTVRDLTREQVAMMDVEWLSAPVACAQPPRQVVWHVYGDDVELKLDLLGERGQSCHGFLVNRLRVRGRVAAPLRVPVFAPPLRCVRRHITGRACTGSVVVDDSKK